MNRKNRNLHDLFCIVKGSYFFGAIDCMGSPLIVRTKHFMSANYYFRNEIDAILKMVAEEYPGVVVVTHKEALSVYRASLEEEHSKRLFLKRMQK